MAAPKAKQPKRVLIVEDEKPMARALGLKLAHVGFETAIASNGEEALALLEQTPFDRVLLDLMMPKLDGFGTLQALKDRGVKTPAVVLSNLSQAEDEKRAKALGAKKFFVKSDTPIATIVAYVQETLG